MITATAKKLRHSAGLILAALLVALALPMALAAPASAAPRLDRLDIINDRLAVAYVYSPSMDRVIRNDVILPANRGAAAPVLYLLNGVDGGEEGVGWVATTDAVQFLADKQVHAVIPIGGRYSIYTDWRYPDPTLGVNKWQTYLTQELPAVINGAFNTTGRNAIAGLSLSGASALDLAIQAPNLYSAVGAFSGCPQTSSPQSIALTSAIVGFAGGNIFNAWGPPWDPAWAAHDPSVNAERLRGKAIYLSSGSGIAGPNDRLPLFQDPFGPGAIEAVTNACTSAFAGQLASMGIPATFDQLPTGAHNWGLFEHQLHLSWRVLGPAIGA